MIIAGFAGVGKTYFCDRTKNAIDFVVMPFKYSNFYRISKKILGDESIKANEELKLVIGWDEYYYHALVDTFRKYPEELILIPTVISILERLRTDNIPYIIVYPNITDKREYERRYKERGNSDEFMKIFLDKWNEWLNAIANYVSDNAIELSGAEYLMDVIEVVSYEEGNIIHEKEQYIYNTYFKYGLDKRFTETLIGKIMEEFNVYE